MAFINWLDDVCNPLGNPAKVELPPSGTFLWVHPVTGTRYFLEAGTAEEIAGYGLAWAEALIQGKEAVAAADLLSAFMAQRDPFSRKLFLINEGWDGDATTKCVPEGLLPLVTLWPELPYPGLNASGAGKESVLSGWLRGKDNPCVRLADFLLLRTGLFFVLAADRIAPDERPSLRLTSLLDVSGVWGLPKAPAGLTPIPEELRGAYETATLLAGYPDAAGAVRASEMVELVEGSVFKVKEYYLETNRISEIRGASVLLDDINRKRYSQMLRQLSGLAAESVVYAGGGHVMAVVPEEHGEKVAGEIERLHREVCLTARAVGVACRVRASDLADLPKLRSHLAEAVANRRSVLLPSWNAVKGAIDLYHDGFSAGTNLPLLPAGPGEYCASCGIRRAVKRWSYKDETRPLCASCLRKQCVGKTAKKTVFASDYRDFWLARGIDADLPAADEIEDIADERNEIAVIYADGNSFGYLFRRPDSLAGLRLLSQFTESAAYTAVFTALKQCEALLAGRSVEIIALGGDDIFMLVPAQAAPFLALEIGESFDRLFMNLTAEEPRATLSLGVVIAGAKTPVRYLFELAQTLLKEAKKRVYTAKDAPKKEGTLDVAVLASYAAYEDNITAYRKATLCKNDAKLTLRPYTFSEARRFMSAVRRLQAAPQVPGRSWFYGLRRAAEQYSRQVAELFFNYQYARLREEQRRTVRECWETLTQDPGEPQMFLERGGAHCCPWLDVVELWNYVGAGGETR